MLALVVTVASCAEGNAPDGGVLTGYTVSGTVTGAGKDNATLTLQGAGSPRTATSNATGGYQFLNVPTGDYTLTVSKKGFAYTPPSQVVKVASKDFAVPAISSVVDLGAYAVSGTISGDVKSSIQVKLVGNGKTLSATTNSSGAFSIAGATAGTYTLTPSLTGYSFSPASRTVTVAGAAVTGQDFGGLTLGWSTRSPAGKAANWSSIAMSSDGKYLVASVEAGRVYTSSDYGATWQVRDPVGKIGQESQKWRSVAISNDGKYVAVCNYDKRLYTTSDYGAIWTDKGIHNFIVDNFLAVAMSNDGQNLAVLTEVVGPIVSNNSGGTWESKGSVINSGSYNWSSIAMSSDGNFVAVGLSEGLVFVSSDKGVTWQNKSVPNFVRVFKNVHIAISDDGNVLAAAIGGYSSGGRMFVSKDSGKSWQEKNSNPIANDLLWQSVAMSNDGTKIAAVVIGGGVYLSSDSGDSWKLISSGAASGNLNWTSVAISEDGRFLWATVSGGLVYSYAAP